MYNNNNNNKVSLFLNKNHTQSYRYSVVAVERNKKSKSELKYDLKYRRDKTENATKQLSATHYRDGQFVGRKN